MSTECQKDGQAAAVGRQHQRSRRGHGGRWQARATADPRTLVRALERVLLRVLGPPDGGVFVCSLSGDCVDMDSGSGTAAGGTGSSSFAVRLARQSVKTGFFTSVA